MTKLQKIGVALPLGILLAAILLSLPRNPKLNYEYRKGAPWKYETLISPFDFPILKTDDQILAERLQHTSRVVPYYRYSDEVVGRSLRNVQTMELGPFAQLRPAISAAMGAIYEKGIVSDEGVTVPQGSSASDILYIQRGKKAVSCPVSEVYLLAEAREALKASVAEAAPGADVDSLFRSVPIADLMVPNLSYDKTTTDLVRSGADSEISPTLGYVSAGQLIVSNGEIVTAETAQVIASYEREYSNNISSGNPGVLYWTGNAIVALMIVLLFFLSVLFFNPAIFADKGRFLYLLMVFAVFTLASIIVPRVEPGMVCMVPFVLCALFLEAFFDDRLILLLYSVSLYPIALYADNGVALFFVFLIGGVVSMISFKRFNKGWRQFLNAFITFAVMFVVYLGLHFTDFIGGSIPRTGMYLLISAMLCVAGYPLTYLFERIFNLVSVYRLSELCDTSLPLLRELEQKAPGTFQHSLQVMNMADAVAVSVGADVLLIRAGALYHDIGKMLNPLCFVENESMLAPEGVERYHDNLSPVQSAQYIIRHVTDGLELAQRHHLPSVIRDFIATHHGTTAVTYFYDKHLRAGGDESDRADFTYPGGKPVTREQVILMLCDSIEAASRSLKDYSAASFDRFVEGIVAGKEEEGQFTEAEISLRDLCTVKASLKAYLSQMYHERIAYPKRKIKQ